jgi:hypothetical protein
MDKITKLKIYNTDMLEYYLEMLGDRLQDETHPMMRRIILERIKVLTKEYSKLLKEEGLI